MKRDKNLTCYGCAHSIGDAKFPSGPSGERPCMFCIRNSRPVRVDINTWYDGSKPVKVPMDCYHSLDMTHQYEEWRTVEAIGKFRQHILKAIKP